jgi:protein O-mannosyl-transferase
LASDGIQRKDGGLEWTRTEWLLLASILAGTFLCYAPALGYEFVYDDRLLILKNPQILSWRFVPHFFLENFIAPAYPHAPAVYYRPVLLVWMVLNAKIWGMHPPGWHFTAIALHLIVIVEVYILARKLMGSRFAAAVAAGVMALHPVHVECVAWVMAEAEPLAASLMIGSLLLYLHTRAHPARRAAWMAASLTLFALAVLIKENSLVLPGLIFACEWFWDGTHSGGSVSGTSLVERWWRRGLASFLRSAPHLAVAFAYLALRIAVLKTLGHAVTPLSLATHLATLPLVLSRYLRILLWPAGLSVFYDVPYVTHLTLTEFFLPLAAVAAAIALLAWWGTKSPAAGFAAVWLGLPILPVLDLPVFYHGEIVHDRYLYLPSVGFALLVALAFERAGKPAAAPKPTAGWRVVAAIALIAVLGAGTCYDRQFWRNNLTLFERGMAIAPGNNIAANNLANELVDRGRYDDALGIYHQVLARDPSYWPANYNAGYCYYRVGRLNDAEQFLARAAALDPSDADTFVYLGLTYLKMNRLELAASAVGHAIALDPRGRGYHFALGMILRNQGDLEQARTEFQAELANYPDEAAAARELQQLDRRRQGVPSGSSKP